MDASLTASAVSRLLTPVFREYNVRRAILFGSAAKGTAQENSDLDIVVDSGLKGLQFVGLCEDIRRTVHREIDLFDVTHIRKDSVVDHEIRKTGVVIYEE